ncbi:HigA family addiction module antidote protein [Companilactobacillus farciminis]|jgi:addiction module HigA family antidote|nr:HigA family addiction module antidote protein [Companilactobacillus farciminis]
MSKEVEYKDLIAFHPGSYVEDIVEELNITQAEFADRLGTSSKTVSKIINGEDNISNDIANKLSKVTGISVKTWMNLQEKYDLKILEIQNQQNADEEEEICKLIDFGYFKRNGLVDDRKYKTEEKISVLRKLLNIADLSSLSKFNALVSYRNTKGFSEKTIVNSNVMLEIAMNKARNATSNKYQKSKLEHYLPQIKKLSLEKAETFYPRLKEILLECGIVLVALPMLKNASLNGATKKFKNGSVMLLITDRNKKSDIFWFTLIHELGHIYCEDFYSNYSDSEAYRTKEERADKFASDFFIPEKTYQNFVSKNNFTSESILDFASELGILPGIVVGRLQKEKYIDYNKLNFLKSAYTINFV